MNEENFFTLSQKDIDTIIPETQLENRNIFKRNFKDALCDRIENISSLNAKEISVDNTSIDDCIEFDASKPTIVNPNGDTLLVIEEFKNVAESFSECNNL